ncbi:hypothetical protein CGLO_12301 [Colletotrichum gloeosporioides Cg-14]|uniref:Hsp70-like protein n=1 Tax=Colletotrichum gloeosporioides (strain Cg-14) TaxID=1237896 RepID=T0LJX4_COLGC|nr:hypothetical protein CGLO_12301 [Colletotrichum gloeosporioides Cg-14]
MSGLSGSGGTPPANENVIVIGIDFGTTFSGVSWAFSGQPNEVEVITNWEAELNFNSDTEKTPTTLLYSGMQGQASWGYGIPADTANEPLKWFKLLLIDREDLPKSLRDSVQITTANKLMDDANKAPTEVISGYLRRLWNHSIECIGDSISKELVKMCKFHVVITLPAIWPDYAKARMKKAAKDAGILKHRPAGPTHLSFISEPEAAALATMRDLGCRPNIKVGDHFVVCDAGGGTVDLISYEVTELKPMVVREVVKGSGALCGGVFLDEGFVELLKTKLEAEAWNNMPAEDVKKMLNGDWEHGIKQQFDGKPRNWHVTLPASCRLPNSERRGMMRQALVLTAGDLLPVFESVSQRIVKLVSDQIGGVLAQSGKLPKYIILVGGFGRCRYLRSRIQSSFGGSVDLLQSQGNKPWTAICRGAVVQGLTRRNLTPGLSVKVQSRIARASYGVGFNTRFDPSKHLEKDKFWCDVNQEWKAKNQIHWYLEHGNDVSEAKPVYHDFIRRYEAVPNKIVEDLEYSVSSAVPKRADSSTQTLCSVTWNKKINFESLPTYTNCLGKVYYELRFRISMVSDGASLDFSITHNGKQVAAKNVMVEYVPLGGEATGKGLF